MLRKNLISQVERENDLIKDKHLECYDREHQKVKTDGMGYNKEIFLMPKEIFITFQYQEDAKDARKILKEYYKNSIVLLGDKIKLGKSRNP